MYKMENSLNIENITNGLVTLQKVKQLYNPEYRKRSGNDTGIVQPDRLSLLVEILSTVTNFIPMTRGGSYRSAFYQGNRYSNAYRELKKHIRSKSRASQDPVQLLQSLKLVTPLLDNKEKVYMDKIVRIVDILQS